MVVLGFLIKLFAATGLLLFGVRQVRGGIERRFGGAFKALLTRRENVAYSAGAGMIMALVIQSSAAVALLLTGFASAGLVNFGAALAGILGADFGSALIVQILSFDLSWLMPLLLAVGCWVYLRASSLGWRETGRVILGVGLVLLALQFLREAVAPIGEASFLPAAADYLARDFVTAFIVGAALAFVMQSSVAATLVSVTLVQIGALPFEAGLSIVMGSNLGSTIIPVWLAKDQDVEARRIPMANFLVRGGAAIFAVLGIHLFGIASSLNIMGSGQSLIIAHVTFNFAVMVAALPFVRMIEKPMKALMPVPIDPDGVLSDFDHPVSALGESPRVAVALSSIQQELLNMVGQVERMFRPVTELYENENPDALMALSAQDKKINGFLAEIRRFTVRLPRDKMSDDEKQRSRELMDYAVRLEAAGDIISDRFTRIARNLHAERDVNFSSDGWGEICRIHQKVLEGFTLARHILLDGDLESARMLVLEKAEVKRMARNSRNAHFNRLERGATESFESSDLHLETLRAMRELHGHIASVAYPHLYRAGQILDTRLVQGDAMEEDD